MIKGQGELVTQLIHICKMMLQHSKCISQNHELVEVRRDLKQAHNKLLRMMCRYFFNISSEGICHNCPGQLVPMLSHPHSEKVFPDVQNLLCFSLCPLPLAP